MAVFGDKFSHDKIKHRERTVSRLSLYDLID